MHTITQKENKISSFFWWLYIPSILSLCGQIITVVNARRFVTTHDVAIDSNSLWLTNLQPIMIYEIFGAAVVACVVLVLVLKRIHLTLALHLALLLFGASCLWWYLHLFV